MMRIILLFLITTNILLASIGSITLVDGKANIKRANQTLLVKVGDSVEKNDHIYTEANSKVKIAFNDNTIITIGKNSTLDIADYLYDAKNSSLNKADLKVAKGAFHAITGEVGKLNPSKFKLKTSTASIGIRGTEIYGDQTSVFCTDGAIFVESFDEMREIPSGNYVLTYDNAPPSEVMPIDTSGIDGVKGQLNTLSLAGGFEDDSGIATPAAMPEAMVDSPDSWGYWADEIRDENNLANIGIDNGVTDPAYVQALIDSSATTTLSFNGSIAVDNPAITGITQNSLSLIFTLGGQAPSLGGEIDFAYSGGSIFLDIHDGIVTANGFSASDPDYPATSINGNFYGSQIDSIRGNIFIDKNTPMGITGGTPLDHDISGTFDIGR